MRNRELLLTSVSFSDYRIFSNEAFRFEEYRNDITGANGSGKTTIITVLKKMLIYSSDLEYVPKKNESIPNVKVDLIFGDETFSLLGYADSDLHSFSVLAGENEQIYSESLARETMASISSKVADLDQLYSEARKQAEGSRYFVSPPDVWMGYIPPELNFSELILGEAQWENEFDSNTLDSEAWLDFEAEFDLGGQSVLASDDGRLTDSKYYNLIHLWSGDDRLQIQILNKIAHSINLESFSAKNFQKSTHWNRGCKISTKTELNEHMFVKSPYEFVNIEGHDINGVINHLSKQNVNFLLIIENEKNWYSSSKYFGIITNLPVEKTLVARFHKDFDFESFQSSYLQKQDCERKTAGLWVVPSDFFGIEPILAENEIREITPLDRRQRYDFEEIVQNWKFFKLNEGLDNLLPESNSIFLETDSYIEGDFCKTFKEVSKRPKDQNLSGKVQIHFDPKKANSDYVKIILNGVLKSKYMRLLSYNGKINHQNLVNLFHLYLPDIDEQQAIADHYDRLYEEINEKKVTLNEVSMPSFTADKIDSYSQLDWINDIPYPLASILQTFRTIPDTEPDRQLTQLLYFFEAFSQFLATVNLSAWTNSPNWERIWGEFSKKQEKQNRPIEKSLAKPDFGFWNRLNNKFRKENNKDDADLSIYSGLDSEFLSMVKSREITEILEDCAKIRNNTKGHGVIRNQVAVENLGLLLKKLNRLRGPIHRAFATVVMIRPGLGQMKSKYHCRVELLTGISTPFQTKELQFTSPPSSDYDFLTTPGSEDCLRLAPLLKRGPHMESFEYSYYYYSRKSDQEVSFNNYHSTIVGTKEYPADGETELLGFLSKLEP